MEVIIKGIAFDVEFEIVGKYFPQTRQQPAEYPEVEVTKISTEEDLINVLDVVNMDDIQEAVEAELNSVEEAI